MVNNPSDKYSNHFSVVPIFTINTVHVREMSKNFENFIPYQAGLNFDFYACFLKYLVKWQAV